MQFHQEILIRERAYAIWEQEGRPQGREWDHWVRAAGEFAKPAETPAIQAATRTARPVRKPQAKGKSKKA
jgi:hypothetical protein